MIVLLIIGKLQSEKASHFLLFPQYRRYGQVVVVIGVNPNKTYPVSPIQRVEILRKMIDSKKLTRNVRVEGMY